MTAKSRHGLVAVGVTGPDVIGSVARHQRTARDQRRSAFEDRVAAAVEQGELTRDEADVLVEANRRGVLPLDRSGHGGPTGHRGAPGAHRFGDHWGPTPDDAA